MAHLEDDQTKFEDHIDNAKKSYENALKAASGDDVPRSLYLLIAQDACGMKSDVLGDERGARDLAQEVYHRFQPQVADMDGNEVSLLDNIRQFLLQRSTERK